MKCKEAEKEMSKYLDQELSPLEVEQLLTHVKVCRACAYKFGTLNKYQIQLSKMHRMVAPDDFLDKVRAGIQDQNIENPAMDFKKLFRLDRKLVSIVASVLVLILGYKVIKTPHQVTTLMDYQPQLTQSDTFTKKIPVAQKKVAKREEMKTLPAGPFAEAKIEPKKDKRLKQEDGIDGKEIRTESTIDESFERATSPREPLPQPIKTMKKIEMDKASGLAKESLQDATPAKTNKPAPEQESRFAPVMTKPIVTYSRDQIMSSGNQNIAKSIEESLKSFNGEIINVNFNADGSKEITAHLPASRYEEFVRTLNNSSAAGQYSLTQLDKADPLKIFLKINHP